MGESTREIDSRFALVSAGDASSATCDEGSRRESRLPSLLVTSLGAPATRPMSTGTTEMRFAAACPTRSAPGPTSEPRRRSYPAALAAVGIGEETEYLGGDTESRLQQWVGERGAVATKFAPTPWRNDAQSVVDACRGSWCAFWGANPREEARGRPC